jgi:hypothetical protein
VDGGEFGNRTDRDRVPASSESRRVLAAVVDVEDEGDAREMQKPGADFHGDWDMQKGSMTEARATEAASSWVEFPWTNSTATGLSASRWERNIKASWGRRGGRWKVRQRVEAFLGITVFLEVSPDEDPNDGIDEVHGAADGYASGDLHVVPGKKRGLGKVVSQRGRI